MNEKLLNFLTGAAAVAAILITISINYEALIRIEAKLDRAIDFAGLNEVVAE